MKKNILYLFIILIVGALQQSCERDDICIDATTPHLIFRIYDKDKPTQLKKINQLKVTIIDAKADTIRFSNTDSIALPIKVDTDITKYKFISNTNTIVRIDTINLSYTREDVFVGRSCGYKTIFNNTLYLLKTNHWIDSVLGIEQQIENENQAHVKLFF